MRVCVCVYLDVYVCIYVCMYVCVCVRMYNMAYRSESFRARPLVKLHTYTYIHTMHISLQEEIIPCSPISESAYIYIHTIPYIYIHTYHGMYHTYTYIHTMHTSLQEEIIPCSPISEILDTRTRSLLRVVNCKGYVMSNQIVSAVISQVLALTNTHTHTHTYIYVYV